MQKILSLLESGLEEILVQEEGCLDSPSGLFGNNTVLLASSGCDLQISLERLVAENQYLKIQDCSPKLENNKVPLLSG